MDERDLFLTSVDALNSGDLAAMPETVHPEFVFHPIRAEMTGDYDGFEGIEKFVGDNAE